MEPNRYDSLDGQVTLVTGANRGIGQRDSAGARRPGRDGVRGRTRLVLRRVRGNDGGRTRRHRRVVARTCRRRGNLVDRGLDVLGNDAGVGVLTDPIEDGTPAYRVSKAGIYALTAPLNQTYGDDRLIANSVDPGWVATEMGGSEAPREPEEAPTRQYGWHASDQARRPGCSGRTARSSTTEYRASTCRRTTG